MIGVTGDRTIFYKSARGTEPAREFIRGLPSKAARAKCYTYLERFEAHDFSRGPISGNIAKHIEGNLYEVRPEFGGTEYRLYALDSRMVR